MDFDYAQSTYRGTSSEVEMRRFGRFSKVKRRIQKTAPSFLLLFCGKKVERCISLLFFSSKKNTEASVTKKGASLTIRFTSTERECYQA
jgi:hypothetical protein